MSGLYRKPVLIYNPAAGKIKRSGGKLLRDVQSALSQAGFTPELIPTTGPGVASDLARQAIDRGSDLIIGLGGDGTINEIASGVIGSRVPLAILPGGTANVLSIETRGGTNAVRTASQLATRVPKRIAVGKITSTLCKDRYFLAMVGVGLDAKIVHNVNPAIKSRTGKFAYWVAGFQQFAKPLDPIPLDEKVYGFVLASRVRNYGGDLELARNASLLRDEFEIVKFRGTNPLFYAFYMLGAVVRQHLHLPGISAHKGAILDFPKPGAHVQADGEYAGQTPARVELVPDALTLLVPPNFAG
ncbi:diacylglycerol kinase [Bryobacterales bacterium F-183]|nr:diacylglycerol kinase [Bryobacterales bacterium F-183]